MKLTAPRHGSVTEARRSGNEARFGEAAPRLEYARDKHRTCLDILADESTDLVDAYLVALHRAGRVNGVYSFDEGLEKRKVPLLPVS